MLTIHQPCKSHNICMEFEEKVFKITNIYQISANFTISSLKFQNNKHYYLIVIVHYLFLSLYLHFHNRQIVWLCLTAL